MTERATYPKSTCCIPGCTRWSRTGWKRLPDRLFEDNPK